MDLHALRCFVAVAQELNFNRAAERLHMTQPPLTRVIARLEHSLGTPLFTRTTRRVAMTAAGRVLLGEVRPLLEHADETARVIRHTIADRSQRFIVGCTATAFFTILPELVDEFRRRHPGVEFDVSELPTDALLAALASAEIDAAVLLMPAAHPKLEIRPVLRQRMRLAVASGHEHARSSGPVPLGAFANDTFILHARDENPAMYDEVVRCCARAGFRPRMKEKTREQSCMGLVTAGVGVHFVCARSECLQAPSLRFLEIEGAAPVFELAVAYRRGDPSPYLDVFKEVPALPSSD